MTEDISVNLKGLNVAVVGAGFSGAVIARELSEAGAHLHVFEARNHIAGNCHSERDPETGVMAHVYGPHIFHTDYLRVWDYVQRFGSFMPYVNRVKAQAQGRIFTLPINLLTINQFFGKTLSPNAARSFIESLGDVSIESPLTFEDQALRFIGRDLYEAFFKGYTEKQWGVSPRDLPASILKRLPVRFNYDDNYFAHRFQGMPREGYTDLVGRMLDHASVSVHLGVQFDRAQVRDYDHVFYSGPIDAWFGHDEGRLGYRTLDFEAHRAEGDAQGCAVMNYCDRDIPWTRISEHKHFAPWETHEKTLCFKEFSRSCEPGDTPYYPTRLVHEMDLLKQYVERAEKETGMSFVGRLGTYRYLDMDVTIKEALEMADAFKLAIKSSSRPPVFSVHPLNA